MFLYILVHKFVTMTFAGIEDKYTKSDSSKIWLQSIAYDGTSTWRKGADKGFSAFLEASQHLELFDIETQSEVYRNGIHILPEIHGSSNPESLYNEIYNTSLELLKKNKFLTFFGGEHSISIGIIRAFYEHFNELTILHLDAHADLRPSYLGSRYNHACALHDASQNANLVQVGIRSMDKSELKYMNNEQCFFAEKMRQGTWMKKSIEKMGKQVYITLDLDVLDPSVMPSTGTPEPGGISWETLISYLSKIFSEREVVGFDIVELAPIPELKAPDFLAAKLYYKMLSYKFFPHGK